MHIVNKYTYNIHLYIEILKYNQTNKKKHNENKTKQTIMTKKNMPQRPYVVQNAQNI